MPKNEYFSWDSFLMGGGSIVACFLAWMFTDRQSPVHTASQFAFVMAFAINHPHFLSSYMLLYGDFRKKILKNIRYFIAGILVPFLLAASLLVALIGRDVVLMGHIATAMYFFVGWHYVKQVFGCVVVTSAQRKIFYKRWERNLLLANLFPVWFMSWFQSHTGYGSFDFYGIPHYSLQLPKAFLMANYALVGITFIGVILMQMNKYVKEGVKPSPPAVMAFLALYAWYLPVSAHPSYAYFIPMFHSLQYLAFVWLLKKNQVADEIKDLENEAWRSAWVSKFLGFMAMALALGALFFELLPKTMDKWGLVPENTLGTSPMLASFLLFINIHHYFIDNAIWRSDNETVKKFLFQARHGDGAGGNLRRVS